MRRKLDPSDNCVDFILKLDSKRCAQVTRRMFVLLANPYPHDSQALKGEDGLYRIDVGEFRVVYSVSDEVIEVMGVGRRNDDDIYREIRRKRR